ncbi:MAG: NusG domain II-containing protein [Lachnospiraceae bacterium]|jgi:hypothetical protein|nr:NusG domain II-containing protein [Lachnospiraceae bacterium]
MCKRNDLILIALLLGLAAALCFAVRPSGVPGDALSPYVLVTVDGEEYARYSLGIDQEHIITGTGGGTNRLIIRGGMAYVEEATCPDKICIHQGKIHEPGELIVCLPNRVVVSITEK